MIRGLIGVVHLKAMPGDPAHRGTLGFAGVREAARRDADALADGGADAIIVENFGSAPFVKGTAQDRLPPHQVATLALVARELKDRCRLPVGVNCLRNDAPSAIGIAAAAELDFIRVNVHSGAYLTDQGIIEGEAAHTLRYRQALGAKGVLILADVLVKHAWPLVPMSAEAATRDTLERGLADGIIVTGVATGAAIDLELLTRVRQSAGVAPVYLGSGVTSDNAAALAAFAAGAVVGSWLKHNGELAAAVDVRRVRRLAAVLHGKFPPIRGRRRSRKPGCRTSAGR
jgi:uncharacterized protein